MSEPLERHVLNNLGQRAQIVLREGRSSGSSRLPAHMLSLIEEVRASREILETKEEPRGALPPVGRALLARVGRGIQGC